MIVRTMPRRLRLAALSMPLVVTASCSSTAPPAPPTPAKGELVRHADGSCWYTEPKGCLEGTKCVPAPQAVDCPEDVSLLTFDQFKPAPKPVVWRDAEGLCWQEFPTPCEEANGATCKAPPAEGVACPEDLSTLASDAWTPPKPPPLERPIRRGPNGHCFIDPVVNCPPPEVATCNPPPPRRVPCPEDRAPEPQINRNPPPPGPPGPVRDLTPGDVRPR